MQNLLPTDCSECFADILQAVGDCVSFTDPAAIIKCVQDIIGAANPCYECICELITDIGNLFGQDWHCWFCLIRLKNI